MVLGQLVIHVEEPEIRSELNLHRNIKFKWNKDLNMKVKCIQLLEEKLGEYLYCILRVKEGFSKPKYENINCNEKFKNSTWLNIFQKIPNKE